MDHLRRGEVIRIRQSGSTNSWAEGEVILASPVNPPGIQSILVLFMEHPLYVDGNMFPTGIPLLIDYTREKVTSPLTGAVEFEAQILEPL